MTDKIKQTIEEELAKLPKGDQAAINSVDWVKLSEDIGLKYSLNEDAINNLQVETLLVLVGIEDPNLFAINIEYEVSLTKEKAEKISVEVFEKIFTPINNILLENIKKSEKVQNSGPEQNLDFILSGGDYSAFVNGKTNSAISTAPAEVKTKIPTKPVKINDIKSKFTI